MESSETATLLACLRHILLPNSNRLDSDSNSISDITEPVMPESEAAIMLWKSGKATDIMKRFKSGTLTCAVMSSKDQSNENNVPMSMSKLETTIIKPNLVCPVKNEDEKISLNQTSKRRFGFRPPLRQPEIENIRGLTIVDNNSSSSLSHPVHVVNPGLFTLSSSGVSNKMLFSTTSNYRPAGHEGGQFQKFNGSANVMSSQLADEQQKKLNGPFKTAYDLLRMEDKAKGIKRTLPAPGATVPDAVRKIAKLDTGSKNNNDEGASDNPEVNELMADERLKNIEPKMVEAILNEVVELGASTDWNDIAGLNGVKEIIKEVIIWPMQRPDLFTGLRGPPKGILLFGPPGTGKTMFGRLIATKSQSTFFNISASSLMSKWCGDGEKMVRALFQVARVKQPSVIFIDEIDSILTQRNDTEHETSRRLKTEFLIQFDGCGTKADDKILVIGVTNRPQELDEAARRRLVKRIYIPLPDAEGRQQLVRNLLSDQQISLDDDDYGKIANLTDGYSGADMASLCKEAAYGPIRDIGHDMIQSIQADSVRPIKFQDFGQALKHVKASVALTDLTQYEIWDKQFGCRG